MTAKNRYAVTAVAAVACFVLLGAFAQSRDQQRQSEALEMWQRKISQANLEGCTPAEVSRYLDLHNIPHEPYDRLIVNGGTAGAGQDSGCIAADLGQVAHTISPQGLCRWSVVIGFYFDEHARCSRITVGGEAIG